MLDSICSLDIRVLIILSCIDIAGVSIKIVHRMVLSSTVDNRCARILCGVSTCCDASDDCDGKAVEPVPRSTWLLRCLMNRAAGVIVLSPTRRLCSSDSIASAKTATPMAFGSHRSGIRDSADRQ